MEHSRLLKFFKQQRSIPDMAEAPTFKIQVDYQNPENVEAEVPVSQEIREVDSNTVSEVTDSDFTLSPVITVTKKESAFTKGDLKLQKVTVAEDIAIEELQNGGLSKITRTVQSSVRRDGKTITRTTSTTETSHRNPAVEDKPQEERKSKIPMLKFKQTVEKVKKENKSRQKPDEQVGKRPRKSSIPKLSKETKRAIKKHETTPKTKALAPEDEFEKIYEAIADKNTDIDSKVLSVKLEDTEKVESKFEELMHSYEDDGNDISVVQVERLRQSKIPALRRRKADGDANKLSSIVNNIRMQSAVRNSREFPIEDEFGEVTTKTISTKRFGRVNSREAAITVDSHDDSNDNTEVIKNQRIIKQTATISKPVISTVTRTEKVASLDANDNSIREVSMIVDASNDNAEVIKTTRIIKQSTRITTPVVSTVTHTEKVTEIDPNDDYDTNINQSITTRKIITKRTLVPEVTELTDDEEVVIDTTESNITDINDSARSIARERIIREITKVRSPVINEFTVTDVINDTNPDDGNQYTIKKEINRTESIVKNTNVGTIENSCGLYNNPNNDTIKQAKDSIDTNENNVASNDINNDVSNKDITQILRVTVSMPVLTKEKSIKVITTQTSVNSNINKELVNTDVVKEAFEIDTSKEASSQIVNADTNITHGITKGVMVTEQIVREGIKIGIPEFTKLSTETLETIDVNGNGDMKDVSTDRDKDIMKITHVTRTHSQENVQNVITNLFGDHTDRVTEVNDFKYNKVDDQSVKNQGSDNKMAIRETNITKTVINLETKPKLTEDKSIQPIIDTRDKELTIITNKKDTKPNTIDVTNQSEIKDKDSLLLDKNGDFEEITVLKGNVSRLINKLSSRETCETNKESTNCVEINTVNQERIIRLDKMISDFNNVDYKILDENKYANEAMSKTKEEDSIVYTQDKGGENVAIMRGNVSRLINKLGTKDNDTIMSSVIIHKENKSDENINKLDDKSNQNVTEQGIYNIKHVNTDTVVTVIKKELIDSSNLTLKKDSTNIIETKKEIIESIQENTNIDTNKEILDSRTAELENDDNTEIGIDIKKEMVDSGYVAPEKDNNDDDIIRGSVSRLINKISSKGNDKSEIMTQDLEKEMPKKKSVLSKIAIFERLEPKESYPKSRLPRSENKLSTLVVKDISISEKPRIVDEVLKDHAKFNPNNIDNKDMIAITSINETRVRAEPMVVNEIWKTSFDKDRRVQNVSVTQRQEIMSFTTQDNKVEISTNNTDNISYTEDANIKPIDAKSSTENVQSNVYFISDKDSVQHEATEVTTEDSKQIYDRVKHKYNIYEQNAITISQEINRSESREYALKYEGHTIDNGATTAEVKGEFKFDYPIVKGEDLKQFNDVNGANSIESVTGHFEFNEPIRCLSKDDYRRAKSLAEADLGEAVRGQVNRMIGRMKSVDIDRGSDVIKTEKISIKEMPRKSSVLEKIALFEGKSASARLESPTQRAPRVTKKATIHLVTENIHQERTTEQGKTLEITTVTPPKIAAGLVITEEMYQEKIRELEAAKSLYQPVEVPTITLGNGVEMPVIALGTALLDPRLIPHIIGAAIDLGYRAIDTAYIYGNEKVIGDAIKAKIDDGTVKREELYIMSKLWSTFHRGDLVEAACKATLENLGLTYIDLFMIHNPMSFKEGGDPIPRIATVLQYSQHDFLNAWFAMEKLVSQGLVRSIGVSNFNSSQIQRILDKGRIKPVVNQVECHPYLSQERLDDFCASRNIALSCFGVLGSKGTPAEYKSSVAAVIDDPLVQVMAHGLNVTPAELLIRYQIQSEHNVVVKSSSGTHLKDNLNALNFTLSEPQMKALHALNKNKRMFTFLGMGETHKNYPFAAPY